MSTNYTGPCGSQSGFLVSVCLHPLENINPVSETPVLLTVVPPVPRTSGTRKGEKAELERPTGRRTLLSSGPVSLHRQGSKIILKTLFKLKSNAPFKESVEGRILPVFFLN